MRVRRIQDDLSDSGLPPDRVWQLRNMREGKCVHCGDRRDYKMSNGLMAVSCLRCTKKYNKQRREKYAREKGLL